MTNTPLKRANRRALTREGRSVTHTTFSTSGNDTYNDPVYTSANATVTGMFRTTNTPRFVRDASGAEVEVDTEVIVADTVTVTDVNGSRPDEFVVNGVRYKVLNAINQDNGLIVCRCNEI